MTLRTILFCGDHSRYGWAHLQPVVERFEVATVVLASHRRWQSFRERLMKEEAFDSRGPLGTRAARAAKAARQWRARRAHLTHLKELGTPYAIVDDANSPSVIEMVRSSGAEVILSAAYPQIFKAELLSATPRGGINFHPSLLPRFRGAHPHYWCVATGADQTGITAHFMTPKIDDGPIVAQLGFGLAGMDYWQLYDRLVEETPEIVARTAAFLQDPEASAIPQDDSLATYFHSDTTRDRTLDWRSMDSSRLLNIVRAGRAQTTYGGRRLRVLSAKARSVPEPLVVGRPAGTVVHSMGTTLTVVALDGTVLELVTSHGESWCARFGYRLPRVDETLGS